MNAVVCRAAKELKLNGPFKPQRIPNMTLAKQAAVPVRKCVNPSR